MKRFLFSFLMFNGMEQNELFHMTRLALFKER